MDGMQPANEAAKAYLTKLRALMADGAGPSGTSQPTTTQTTPHSSSPQWSSSGPKPQTDCPDCGGAGWVAANVPPGHPEYGKAKPCGCSKDRIVARRMKRLDSMDGLTDAERGYTLDSVVVGDDATRQAVDAIRRTLEDGSGFVTRAGAYGRGKTRLLISAINEAKQDGQPAIYT